jgi:dUTPase
MFKVLDGATAPTRATKYSAMVDLYANADVVIGAGETKIIPLGVKIDIEYIKSIFTTQNYCVHSDTLNEFLSTHFLELHPRSSLRAKGLIIGVGVIDLDYPDEIGLIVHNPILDVSFGVYNGDAFKISKGDKVAQCTLMEHKGYLIGIWIADLFFCKY